MPIIDACIELNVDFTRRVVIKPNENVWDASTRPGVKRVKLDRIGDEIVHATYLVRYAPISSLLPNEHSGGEEIFVLEGAFYGEHDSYLVGSRL